MIALPVPKERPRLRVGTLVRAAAGSLAGRVSMSSLQQRAAVCMAESMPKLYVQTMRKRIWHGVSHCVDRPALRMGLEPFHVASTRALEALATYLGSCPLATASPVQPPLKCVFTQSSDAVAADVKL